MSKRAKRAKNGFSLIELLIVVAIILIIAAVAIPNILRAKITANQASAVQSLRTLGSAAAEFSSSYQDGYPPNMTVLGPPVGAANCNTAGLIDAVLVTGQKSGYAFTWHVGADQVSGAEVPTGCTPGYLDMFSVTADPVGFPTGTIHYCIDASGVIRESGAAVSTTSGNGCDPTTTPVGNQ